MTNEYNNLNKFKNSAMNFDEKELFSIVEHSFITDIGQYLDKGFESLEDKLFKMAEKSSTNNLQNLYLSTLNTITTNKKNLKQEFINSLNLIFKSFNKQIFSYCESYSSNNRKSFSLELLDDTELNESLTISNLIRKSNTAYQKQLYALNIRFSSLI